MSGLGYPADGPHWIIRWGRGEGPTLVVVWSTLPGRPWLRCLRRIDGDGWHVSAHRTKREAKEG